VAGGLKVTPCGNYTVYPLGQMMVVRSLAGGKTAFLEGHTSDISAVAMSPDGRRLATGQANHAGVKADVCVWDMTAAIRICDGHEPRGASALLSRFRQHLGRVQALDFRWVDACTLSMLWCGDGSAWLWQYCAAVAFGVINASPAWLHWQLSIGDFYLWTTAPLLRLTGHLTTHTALCIWQLAALLEHTAWHIVNLTRTRCQIVLRNCHRRCSCDGRYLATLGGQDDNTVVVWEVETGRAICGAPAAADSALCVKWLNRRNDRLVTAGNYNLRVWQVDVRIPKASCHAAASDVGMRPQRRRRGGWADASRAA
jgi:WD40 repeat protein